MITKLILYFFIASLTSYALSRVAALIAMRFNICSQVNFRRQGQSTPLLGGIAIYLTIALASVLFESQSLQNICISALPLLLVGIIDDIKELSAKFKTVGHLAALGIWFYIEPSGGLLFSQFDLPQGAILFMAAFLTLSLVNAINFIDGSDGLATSIFIAACLGLQMLSGQINVEVAVFTGAASGFLIRNWPSAKQYLGEVGSSFLGFLLAMQCLSISNIQHPISSVFAVLFVISLPLIDTVMAIIRRSRKGLSPFQGDQDHIHHKLKKIGLSNWQVLAVSVFICTTSATAGYLVFNIEETHLKVASGLVLTFVMLFILAGVYFIEYRLGHQMSGVGKSLIERYMSVKKEIQMDYGCYYAVVIDLLPYYKELQKHGFSQVESFVHRLANLTEGISKDGEVTVMGYYSVAIIFSKDDEWSKEQKTYIQKAFYKMTEEFKLVKNYTKIPDGLYFYSARNPKNFIRMLSSSGIEVIEKKRHLKVA